MFQVNHRLFKQEKYSIFNRIDLTLRRNRTPRKQTKIRIWIKIEKITNNPMINSRKKRLTMLLNNFLQTKISSFLQQIY